MNRFLLPVVALFFCLAPSGYSQEFRIENITSEYVRVEKGLSQNSVYSIIQDQEGFLWIGTWNGLNKFDGYSFRTFFRNPNQPEAGLSNSTIVGIAEDSIGSIWVATSKGLNRIRKSDYTITQFKADDQSEYAIPSDSINTIYSDNQGMIWVGTKRGLIKLNPNNLYFKYIEHNPRDFSTLSSNQITAIIKDKDNKMWVGTEHGLNLLDEEENTIKRFSPNQHPHNLLKSTITCLASDSTGSVWVGTPSGVFRCQIPNHTFEWIPIINSPVDQPTSQSQYIQTIFVDNQNQVWAGTKEAGLFIFDPDLKQFTNTENITQNASLFRSSSIMTMIQDQNGLYWIGASHKGLIKLIPDPHAFYQIISGYSVFGIIEPYPGEFWCGTRNGILRWNRNTKKTDLISVGKNNPISLTSNLINGFYDDDSYFWILTEEGLNRIRKEDRQNRQFVSDKTQNSIAGNVVWHVMKDSRGDYWFSTTNGLSCWNPATNQFTNYYWDPSNKNSLSNNTCYQVFEYSPGRYFISTQNGLNEFIRDENSWRVYLPIPGDPNSISTEYVFGVFKDSKKQLWVYTNGGGFNRFDPEERTFHRYTADDGLSDNTVYSIYEDQNGILWLPTNNGLSRFDPTSKRFSAFNVQEGLLSNEFNINSLYANESGEVFLGGINGVNAFQPQASLQSSYVPVLRLTNFIVHQEEGSTSIILNDTIKLSHNQNTFSISFSILDFLNPFKNQYSIFLENFDKDVTHLTPGTHQVDYRKIHPGHYVLRIKGANSLGIPSNDLNITVFIVPALHQTLWFKITAALLVLLFAALMIYYRYKITSKRHEMEKRLLTTQNELVNSQKFALRSQMNPHFIFNSLNSIQNFVLKNDVDSANYYLSNFSTMMRKVLDYSQHNLILLAEEIELIRLYLQMEHLRFSKKFEIDIKIDPAIDQYLAKIPPMLLQPYLENAILHGLQLIKHKGLLQLLIDHKGDYMLIRIIDNGIGRERARAIRAKTGHISKGLENIEKRIKLYNKLNDKKLEVNIFDLFDSDSQPAGTRVEIIVPYDIEEPSTEIN